MARQLNSQGPSVRVLRVGEVFGLGQVGNAPVGGSVGQGSAKDGFFNAHATRSMRLMAASYTLVT